MRPFFDIHAKGCSCSYCGNSYDKPLHYGLNIPTHWWAHNAWYTVKFWPKCYLRWCHGLRFLKRYFGDK